MCLYIHIYIYILLLFGVMFLLPLDCYLTMIGLLLVPAQDHKRIDEGDQGPNTGGMGAYAPAPCLTARLAREVEEILQRTVDGLKADGRSGFEIVLKNIYVIYIYIYIFVELCSKSEL